MKIPNVIDTPADIRSNVQGYMQGIGGCNSRILLAEQERATSQANLEKLLAEKNLSNYTPDDSGNYLVSKS